MARNQQQTKILQVAVLKIVAVSLIVGLSNVGLQRILRSTNHVLPLWIPFIESVSLLYLIYRFAFYSLKEGYFKTTTHAWLTAGLLILQSLIQLMVTFSPLQPDHTSVKFLTSSTSIELIVAAAFIGVNLVTGLVTYYFALKRAEKKVVKFSKVSDTPQTMRIGGITRKFVIGYLIFTIVFGGGSVIGAIVDIFRAHHYLQILNIVSWLIFITIMLIAFKAKPIASSRLWQIVAPIVIVLDIINLFLQTSGFDILISFILSLPMYFITVWYAYKFMLNYERLQIHKITKEELFV
jgi:hypothetical protein